MTKRQQRAAKIAAQQALTNGARAAGRELTDAEQAQFDALQREIDALTLEIEAEERQAAASAPDHSGRQREGESDPEPDAATIAQRAIEEERQRVTDITNLCRDFDVDPAEHIRDGLREISHPARFEKLGDNPTVILDGAHNPSGMQSLAELIKTELAGRRVTAVAAMMKASVLSAV